MKKLTVLILFTISLLQLTAQDSYIKNRWSAKLGYQTYIQTQQVPIRVKKINEIALSANYGVLNFLECGVSVFYANKSALISGGNLSYIANVNFHILPLFVKKEDFRFDAYINANMGGESWLNNDYIASIPNFIYGFGVGAAVYPFRQFGIFSEYTYGICDWHGISYKWKVGLVYKWKKDSFNNE